LEEQDSSTLSNTKLPSINDSKSVRYIIVTPVIVKSFLYMCSVMDSHGCVPTDESIHNKSKRVSKS